MYDIIIPSNKNIDELRVIVRAIRRFDSEKHNYIPTGFQVSAATNRNYGLAKCYNDIVIMMDDDIGGFYSGWQDELINPLLSDQAIKLVSARLLTPVGGLSPMMGCDYDLSKIFSEADKVILSACIAFRLEDVSGIWFDENYVGSGFEDTDFCFQLREKHKDNCKIVVNNRCALVHFHEMKNQASNFSANQKYFVKKWKFEGFRGLV